MMKLKFAGIFSLLTEMDLVGREAQSISINYSYLFRQLKHSVDRYYCFSTAQFSIGTGHIAKIQLNSGVHFLVSN